MRIITGKGKGMLEFVACITIALAGYVLGFVMGWMDGENNRSCKRDVSTGSPKEESTLCQDYSHLKKKL